MHRISPRIRARSSFRSRSRLLLCYSWALRPTVLTRHQGLARRQLCAARRAIHAIAASQAPKNDGVIPFTQGDSNPFGQPDRQPGPRLDHALQQRIGRRLLGAVLEARVAVLQLLGAELLDLGLERRLVCAELVRLRAVMLV